MTGESTSNAPPDIYYKCCKKKQNQINVCVKCGAVFHVSCAARKNVLKIDECRIICCQKDIIYNSKQVTNLSSLEMENYLLSEIIQQLKEKCSNLLEENSKLKNEIGNEMPSLPIYLNKTSGTHQTYSEMLKKNLRQYL